MIEPRFYEPSLRADRREVRIEGDEGRHLARVLRLAPGARVRVFDGRGLDVHGAVASVDKAGALVTILGPAVAAPEPHVAITIAQAVLKGDGMDAVVRDATMMGVAAIQPVLTARTVVTARALGPNGGAAIARWTRIAVASAKQSGRARLPRIEPPRSLSEVVRATGDGRRLLLVEPAVSRGSSDHALPNDPPAAASLLVGPEGGWAPPEVDAALAAGWTPWALGALTLRADAAALVALGALAYAWGRR